MKTKLTFSVLLVCLWFYAQAQWHQLHPRPTGWSIQSICAPGDQKVFAVVASSILMSDNLGATWNTTNISDGSPYFTEVSFANPMQGAASSYDGLVFLTSDGGASWTKKQLPSTANMYSIKLLPSGTGFVGGDYGKLFKTTDFGQTWTAVQETFDQDDIAKIFLLDENNIFLFDDWDAFYWSNNGGQTWSESYLGNINIARSMHFFDANNGLLGDDYGTLLKTTNGGQSWQVLSDDGETAYYSMSFFDANKGIVGCYDKMMITQNGGQTWQNIDMPDYGDFRAVEWKSESIIYASCDGGIIVRSMDGGVNWEKITQGAVFTGSVSAAAYLDENTIMAFSIYPSEIIKSSNKGYSWTKLPPPAEGFHQYRNVCAVNSETLYAITLGSLIFKTTNAGSTWQTIETGLTAQGGDIYFLNTQTGFFTAMDGTIRRTTDGGENWTVVSNGTPNIVKIRFYDNELGLAVGASGTILRTTNGGLSWTSISNTNTHQFYDVTFINQNLAFASGQWGRLYRSQDAGLTWSQITTSVNNELRSVVFLTPDTGYITTSVFGTNLKTVNGGANWSYDSYLAPSGSRAIKAPNGSILVFGDYGHISILPKAGTWNTPQAPVANDASSINNTSFTANWEIVEGAAAYLLFVSEDNFQTYLPGYIPKYSEQNFATVTGLQAGKTYYYKVLAVKETGYSDYSNIISAQTTTTHIAVERETLFLIYPNPARNFFTIEAPNIDGSLTTIEVVNICGQEILKTSIASKTIKIDTALWTDGIYFIRLNTASGTLTRKLIISR